ncbi:hypothetical protein P3X46_022550 [Hevea brasiliensis]|uniref:Uncharacterized protein n=1 Tax=Hevea brasiliensis TaxID=3981 RepID=A0ABQ9L889_HEVBR|nr:hypothetical protein P3X46_022550 [Hevea brasiliensis]
MLVLIAFSLSIFACSYRKKSRGDVRAKIDLEDGEGRNKNGDGGKQQFVAFEEI